MSYQVVDDKAGGLALYITDETIPLFKELIARAINTFDRAHPEIKELCDLIQYGEILQDYRGQAGTGHGK